MMVTEFLLMIFGFCLMGLGVGLMFHNKKSEAKKPWKPKKKKTLENRFGLGGDFWDYAS